MLKIILTTLIISFSALAGNSCPSYKAQVCHAGSEVNPNFVDICVSFSSLWGHFSNHDHDYYGPCRLRNLKNPYVCNAGMRHKDASSEVCYIVEEDNMTYVNECGDAKNCYCSSPEVANQFDFFSFFIGEFNPFNETIQNVRSEKLSAGKESFNVATNNPLWNRILTENGLSFNLGTERMNGEYFVDMCWVNTTGVSQYTLDFNVGSIIESATHNNLSYPDTTGLMTKFQLLCDFNFDGQYNSTSLSLVRDTDYSPFNVGGVLGIQYKVENAEYCILRQKLVETKPEFLRPHDLKKIVVQNTMLADAVEYDDGLINICNVQANKKNGTIETTPMMSDVAKFSFSNNKHTCTQLQFANSEHLKSYIVTYGKLNEFLKIHQHDYVGICNNTCGPIHGNGAN